MKIAYLYYDFLNLYGESGNIKIIENTLKYNKIKHEILYLSLDDKLNFDEYDLVYIGSGTEDNQKIIFTSDKAGKPCVYMIDLKDVPFVEEYQG